MSSVGLFLVAGLFEISGGYLVWLWFREAKSLWYAVAGFLLLAAYGIAPTFQPKEHSFGRVYAAYGAVFIVLSLLWGWGIDGKRPDLRDLGGAAVCLAGAFLLMWPRK